MELPKAFAFMEPKMIQVDKNARSFLSLQESKVTVEA